ncbi:MAG: DUF4476 domain-containing protein [Sphingobacteriales bacterium]|nr:MAG: DUF4476 domain-containing protein [Sphingobacteriales bacterium]
MNVLHIFYKSLLFCCLFLSITSVAQVAPASSDLIIYSKQSSIKFLVGVNGIQYHAKPVSGIRITEVPGPLCVIQLTIVFPKADTLACNIYLKNSGNYYYAVDTVSNNGKLAVLYEAEDLAPKQIKGFINKTFLPISLKHVVIDTIASYNVRGNAVFSEDSKPVAIRKSWMNKAKCHKPENDNLKVTSIKTKLSERSFESDKMKIAKQQISAGCYTAAQIKELLFLFDFERVKLDLAKFAYHYISDTENCGQISDVFEFNRSIKEWERYIAEIQSKM